MSHYPDFLHNVGQIYTATEVAELLGEDKFGPKYHWLVQQKCINPGPDGVTVLKYPEPGLAPSRGTTKLEPQEQPKPQVKAAPNQEKKNGPSTLPRTGLGTRPAEDQNEHLWAIINKVKGTTQHVGVIVNALIGADSKKRGGFHKVERELTREYLADRTGLSQNTVKKHMDDLVKAGFFVRLDYGKGGSHGKNKAKYQATMPQYN